MQRIRNEEDCLEIKGLAGPRVRRPSRWQAPRLADPRARRLRAAQRPSMDGRIAAGWGDCNFAFTVLCPAGGGGGGSRGRESCACDDVIQLDNNNGATRVSEFRIVRDDVIAHWRGVRCIVGRFLSSECCVHRTN